MLNKIWFWLLLIGLMYGFAKGAYRSAMPAEVGPATTQPAEEAPARPAAPLRDAGQALTEAAFDAATTSVQICIMLIGLMALWLGMLNIARDAGMVDALARALRPATRWLFPDIPPGHPAEGALLMNISANVLGLGNAATPFGLKAMRELQKLNAVKDTATNAMATFLAINTSSVTLVPFTVIGLRVAAGSSNAAKPLAGIILTTAVSTTVAIIAVRLLAKRRRYAMPQASAEASGGKTGASGAVDNRSPSADAKPGGES